MNKRFFFQLAITLAISLASYSCGGDDKVSDTEFPTFTCTESITVDVDFFSTGAIVDYVKPVATDNVSTITRQTAGLPSGSEFPIGTTTNTFTAKDPSGNTATCSFDIIVTQGEAPDNIPYFINVNPTPTGKKWARIEELSDEFNINSFDDEKWHRNPASDGFSWYGRPPALFESDNVSVSDGNLNVTTIKYDTPKTVNGTSWTHGGAIIRSKETASQGHYYECRMQANKTIMSSTFWIAFKQNCNTGPTRKLELDIQECVGRVHSTTETWASQWDHIYHSNTIRHNRSCDIGEETRASGSIDLDEQNNSRFFVYGCWWKSPTEIIFFLDGEEVYSVTPTTDFDLEGYITMAIETYDWNPVDEAGSIFETGTFDDLTTKYDWVRTWKLEDE